MYHTRAMQDACRAHNNYLPRDARLTHPKRTDGETANAHATSTATLHPPA